MPVAQAQAVVPGLTVLEATPDADDRALEELAAWCLRYAPLTAPPRRWREQIIQSSYA